MKIVRLRPGDKVEDAYAWLAENAEGCTGIVIIAMDEAGMDYHPFGDVNCYQLAFAGAMLSADAIADEEEGED
jgi:hypothetical protein